MLYFLFFEELDHILFIFYLRLFWKSRFNNVKEKDKKVDVKCWYLDH